MPIVDVVMPSHINAGELRACVEPRAGVGDARSHVGRFEADGCPMSGPGRHILLLAYYFPPLGGAGVQRNTQVAQHLPELGYRVTVITGPGAPDHRWAPFDDTLAASLPAGVDVHRVTGPEPSWTGSRVQRWLRLKRGWERWWEEYAVPLAVSVGAEADVVYARWRPSRPPRPPRRSPARSASR